MPKKELIRVSNIDVFYGGLQALWDVSLTVRTGEIVGIIGTNGAGKSTLLKAISGIIHPQKGTIEFDGHDITNREPFEIVEMGICQVPEAGRLFPAMSVLENLDIGSYNRNARSKRNQNRKEVFEHFPILEARKNQLAKTFSGGERQMLAIGRGLMSNPKVMLFDEISLGLSPIITNELWPRFGCALETRSSMLMPLSNKQHLPSQATSAHAASSDPYSQPPSCQTT